MIEADETIDSIAVLPFEDFSAAGDQVYLGVLILFSLITAQLICIPSAKCFDP
jgi:hypothetical protein